MTSGEKDKYLSILIDPQKVEIGDGTEPDYHNGPRDVAQRVVLLSEIIYKILGEITPSG